MARTLRPIGHEDRLTLVDHLSELRKRIVYSLLTLVVTFGFCFWQNKAILDIVTGPYNAAQDVQHPAKDSKDPLQRAALFQKEQGVFLDKLAPALSQTATTLGSLSSDDNLTADKRRQAGASATALAGAAREAKQLAQALPRTNRRNLVTLGVTEPFTATLTVAFYAALLLAMPMLLFQGYAFVLPAFSPRERKVALPLMLMVPVLFVAGAAFGYFVVLQRAVSFLQNFNHESFDILLQAKEYFKFAVLFVAGIGLLFQIPVGVLAITRLGILSTKQLAKNRGYVILGISILAAVATPTPDPITMSLAMVPLIVLFELSILLARWLNRVKPPDHDDDDLGAVEHDELTADDPDPLALLHSDSDKED